MSKEQQPNRRDVILAHGRQLGADALFRTRLMAGTGLIMAGARLQPVVIVQPQRSRWPWALGLTTLTAAAIALYLGRDPLARAASKHHLPDNIKRIRIPGRSTTPEEAHDGASQRGAAA